MVNFIVTAAFEHIQESGDISVDIGIGLCERPAHARLSGKVHDPLRLVACEEFRGCFPVCEIDAFKDDIAPPLQLVPACLFQVKGIVRAEIVDSDNSKSLLRQLPCDVKSDETGRAGHENGRWHGGYAVILSVGPFLSEGVGGYPRAGHVSRAFQQKAVSG